jgi:beta-lactam-binding protein with PASTA domain
MKKFFKFIISRLFLFNFLLALVVGVLVLVITMQFLKVYTDHGKSYSVPDLIGMKEAEVKDICSQLDLNYQIVDSVYNNSVDLGAMAEQYPRPEFKVKIGRTLYLVKNSEMPEMVPMPKLLDLSLRRARSTIEAYGLVVGKLDYIPDIGVNVVLRIKVNGELIDAGNEIVKGSVVDLVLGQGLSDDKTHVPNVEGLSINSATTLLNDKFLNVGAVMYDDSVLNLKDSTIAKIFKQYPAFDTINNVNLGFSVDLWLTSDSLKIPTYTPDSILIDSLVYLRDSLMEIDLKDE